MPIEGLDLYLISFNFKNGLLLKYFFIELEDANMMATITAPTVPIAESHSGLVRYSKIFVESPILRL